MRCRELGHPDSFCTTKVILTEQVTIKYYIPQCNRNWQHRINSTRVYLLKEPSTQWSSPKRLVINKLRIREKTNNYSLHCVQWPITVTNRMIKWGTDHTVFVNVDQTDSATRGFRKTFYYHSVSCIVTDSTGPTQQMACILPSTWQWLWLQQDHMHSKGKCSLLSFTAWMTRLSVKLMEVTQISRLHDKSSGCVIHQGSPKGTPGDKLSSKAFS